MLLVVHSAVLWLNLHEVLVIGENIRYCLFLPLAHLTFQRFYALLEVADTIVRVAAVLPVFIRCFSTSIGTVGASSLRFLSNFPLNRPVVPAQAAAVPAML